MEKAKSVLDYFEPYLGRIEIMGSAGRIERVYFEITQSHINQLENPQIKVRYYTMYDILYRYVYIRYLTLISDNSQSCCK